MTTTTIAATPKTSNDRIHQIRIVIADDHPVVRIGVRNMLQSDSSLDVIGEASDGDEAITGTLELLPDILLLDLQMPRLPGLEAMRAIMSGSPTVKILLLTSTITTQQIIEALQIGARGIVLKDALADHLTTAIRAVSSGDYWIGGKRVVNLVGALHELMQQAAVPERKTYGLTPRELEVVGCIVEGCSNRDIAKQFSISEETVKRHLSNDPSGTGTVRHCPPIGCAADLTPGSPFTPSSPLPESGFRSGSGSFLLPIQTQWVQTASDIVGSVAVTLLDLGVLDSSSPLNLNAL
jgi:two-component system nitrate/nitrite response regulator NarL